MFCQLYESCLDNIALVKLSARSDSNKDVRSGDLVTLGEVLRSARYVLFNIVRSSNPSWSDLLQQIRNLVSIKSATPQKISTNSSPARIKRLFGLKKHSKKKLVTTNEIAVVILDLEESNSVDFSLNISDSGFYYLPPQQYTTKSRLLRALNFSGSVPTLVVVDANELFVTTSQGRRALFEDPKGNDFPWADPSPTQAFKGKFLRNVLNANGTSGLETIDSSELKPCVKGLYFGAKWCPPCRIFNKQLSECYAKIKERNPSFEIFFCSSDRSEESFKEHFSSMPWLAFPLDNEKLNQLTRTYDVNGIPTFILLDDDNNLISRHGRSVLLSDPSGIHFPWGRMPLYELTEFTVHRIGDLPSLILFTEGSPGDNEFSMQILKPCADLLFSQLPKSASSSSSGVLRAVNSDGLPPSETNSIDDHNSLDSEKSIPPAADPIQVFYTGEDPICDYILESMGQGQADLPLLMICDVVAGHIAICDKPDVSESIVFDFVSEYREGKLSVTDLPAMCSSEDKRVGGIPVNLIEQIINNQQSA